MVRSDGTTSSCRWTTGRRLAQHLQPDPARSPPRMLPPHLRHRDLDRIRDLSWRRMRPMRTVHQPGQLLSQIPANPPVNRGPVHPDAGGDLRYIRTRQHGTNRVQALLDHRQDNQRQSRPPRSQTPRGDVGHRVPKQTAVADHLANACRTSVDGGQSCCTQLVRTFFTSLKRPSGPHAGHFAGRPRLAASLPARAGGGHRDTGGHAEAPAILTIEEPGPSAGARASNRPNRKRTRRRRQEGRPNSSVGRGAEACRIVGNLRGGVRRVVSLQPYMPPDTALPGLSHTSDATPARRDKADTCRATAEEGH